MGNKGGFWKSGINRAKLNIPRKEDRQKHNCSLGDDLHLINSNWNYEQCIKDILNSYEEPGAAMELFEEDYYTFSERIKMDNLATQKNDVFKFDGFYLVFANLDSFFIDLYKYHSSDADISNEDAYNVYRCIANKLKHCDVRHTTNRRWTSDFYMCIIDEDVLSQKKMIIDDRYELRAYIVNKCRLSYSEVDLTTNGHIACKINYNTVSKYDDMVEAAEEWLSKH